MAYTLKPGEPTILSTGMKVSAKFKGSMCEAEIFKVDRNVLLLIECDNRETTRVKEDQLAGELKVGHTVDYHPTSSLSLQSRKCIIKKIIDNSSYGVVFHDGDQIFVRRRSIKTKSGDLHSHRASLCSEYSGSNADRMETGCAIGKNIDRFKSASPSSPSQLRSAIATRSHPDASDGHAGEHTSDDPHVNAGSIVIVKRKPIDNDKSNFPGIVLNRRTVDGIVTVKRFNDGTEYDIGLDDVEILDRTHFSKDDITDELFPGISSDVLNAVKRYSRNGELPDSWRSVDEIALLVSSDEETISTKDFFLANLLTFFETAGGDKLDELPRVNGQEVDLSRLSHIVERNGGFHKICNKDAWRDVYILMGLRLTGQQDGQQIKSLYSKYLQAFHNMNKRLGIPWSHRLHHMDRHDQSGVDSVSPGHVSRLFRPSMSEVRKSQEVVASVRYHDRLDSTTSTVNTRKNRPHRAVSTNKRRSKPSGDCWSDNNYSREFTSGSNRRKTATKSPGRIHAMRTRRRRECSELASEIEEEEEEEEEEEDKEEEEKEDDEKIRTLQPQEDGTQAELNEPSPAFQPKQVQSLYSMEELPRSHTFQISEIGMNTFVKVEWVGAEGGRKNIYVAKVTARDECTNSVRIHYPGWNRRYDHWLPVDKVLSINEQPIRSSVSLSHEATTSAASSFVGSLNMEPCISSKHSMHVGGQDSVVEQDICDQLEMTLLASQPPSMMSRHRVLQVDDDNPHRDSTLETSDRRDLECSKHEKHHRDSTLETSDRRDSECSEHEKHHRDSTLKTSDRRDLECSKHEEDERADVKTTSSLIPAVAQPMHCLPECGPYELSKPPRADQDLQQSVSTESHHAFEVENKTRSEPFAATVYHTSSSEISQQTNQIVSCQEQIQRSIESKCPTSEINKSRSISHLARKESDACDDQPHCVELVAHIPAKSIEGGLHNKAVISSQLICHGESPGHDASRSACWQGVKRSTSLIDEQDSVNLLDRLQELTEERHLFNKKRRRKRRQKKASREQSITGWNIKSISSCARQSGIDAFKTELEDQCEGLKNMNIGSDDVSERDTDDVIATFPSPWIVKPNEMTPTTESFDDPDARLQRLLDRIKADSKRRQARRGMYSWQQPFGIGIPEKQRHNEHSQLSNVELLAPDGTDGLHITTCEHLVDKQQVKLTVGQQVGLTARQQVELTARQRVELTARQRVELTARQRVELTARHLVELTAGQQLELTDVQQVEPTAGHQVESTAGQHEESTARQQIESAVGQQVELTVGQHVESNSGQQAQLTAGHQVELTVGSQVKLTDAQHVESTAGKQVELTVEQQVELTAGQQVESTAEHQVESNDGQHVELTAGQQVESTAGQQVELTARQQVESTAEQQVESTPGKQVESTARHQSESTAGQQVESTDAQRVKWTTGQQVESTAGQQVELTAGQQVESTVGQQVELTARQQVESTAVQQVESTARPQVESTARQQVESTAGHLVELTAGQQVESTDRQHVESTAGQQVESTAGQQVESTAGDQVESNAGQQVESTAEQQIESTVGQQVELIAGQQVESTAGQHVESTAGHQVESTATHQVESTAGHQVEMNARTQPELIACQWLTRQLAVDLTLPHSLTDNLPEETDMFSIDAGSAVHAGSASSPQRSELSWMQSCHQKRSEPPSFVDENPDGHGRLDDVNAAMIETDENIGKLEPLEEGEEEEKEETTAFGNESSSERKAAGWVFHSPDDLEGKLFSWNRQELCESISSGLRILPSDLEPILGIDSKQIFPTGDKTLTSVLSEVLTDDPADACLMAPGLLLYPGTQSRYQTRKRERLAAAFQGFSPVTKQGKQHGDIHHEACGPPPVGIRLQQLHEVGSHENPQNLDRPRATEVAIHGKTTVEISLEDTSSCRIGHELSSNYISNTSVTYDTTDDGQSSVSTCSQFPASSSDSAAHFQIASRLLDYQRRTENSSMSSADAIETFSLAHRRQVQDHTISSTPVHHLSVSSQQRSSLRSSMTSSASYRTLSSLATSRFPGIDELEADSQLRSCESLTASSSSGSRSFIKQGSNTLSKSKISPVVASQRTSYSDVTPETRLLSIGLRSREFQARQNDNKARLAAVKKDIGKLSSSMIRIRTMYDVASYNQGVLKLNRDAQYRAIFGDFSVDPSTSMNTSSGTVMTTSLDESVPHCIGDDRSSLNVQQSLQTSFETENTDVSTDEEPVEEYTPCGLACSRTVDHSSKDDSYRLERMDSEVEIEYTDYLIRRDGLDVHLSDDCVDRSHRDDEPMEDGYISQDQRDTPQESLMALTEVDMTTPLRKQLLTSFTDEAFMGGVSLQYTCYCKSNPD